VLSHVNSDSYASFNVAWGMVAVAFYVPTAIGQALLAEGGRDGTHLRSQVRLALMLAVGLMTIGAIVTYLGSGLVAQVYGDDYASAGAVLPLMMAAGIPWAVTSLLLSEVRILHRHVATVAITGTLTVAIIVPALILVPTDGIDGASEAWFVGNLIAAVVAVIAVALSRLETSGRDDPRMDDPATVADAIEVGITLAEPTS
jgi:O-antigen/teichoic acid export membrane protein